MTDISNPSGRSDMRARIPAEGSAVGAGGAGIAVTGGVRALTRATIASTRASRTTMTRTIGAMRRAAIMRKGRKTMARDVLNIRPIPKTMSGPNTIEKSGCTKMIIRNRINTNQAGVMRLDRVTAKDRASMTNQAATKAATSLAGMATTMRRKMTHIMTSAAPFRSRNLSEWTAATIKGETFPGKQITTSARIPGHIAMNHNKFRINQSNK